MPRPILGESCTTSIKDFTIFPPHQKKRVLNPFITIKISSFTVSFVQLEVPSLLWILKTASKGILLFTFFIIILSTLLLF